MANKLKTTFICANCSHLSPKWQGRCPKCGEWNTFQEQLQTTATKNITGGSKPGVPVMLSEVSKGSIIERLSSGILELDIVLGGGIVPGSLMLLGGDPGIGKSTLALQSAVIMASKGLNILYVSGEESAEQH